MTTALRRNVSLLEQPSIGTMDAEELRKAMATSGAEQARLTLT
jgi:hypothetical protein